MGVQDRGQEHEAVFAAGDLCAAAGSPAASTRGACTMAAPELRPKASLPSSSTAKFRLLLSTRGKGMRGIEPDRRQHRHQLAEEIILDPSACWACPVGAAQEADILPRPVRSQDLVEQAGTGARPARALSRVTNANTCRGIDAIGPGGGCVQLDLLLQAGDADLEEFVQVAADDAQEAQALQQRRAGDLRPAPARAG